MRLNVRLEPIYVECGEVVLYTEVAWTCGGLVKILACGEPGEFPTVEADGITWEEGELRAWADPGKWKKVTRAQAVEDCGCEDFSVHSRYWKPPTKSSVYCAYTKEEVNTSAAIVRKLLKEIDKAFKL